MEDPAVADFIYELSLLKELKREGWRYIRAQGESLADHSLRTAQIAFILAKMEGLPDPEKACAMAVFHEIGECRIGDVHLIGKTYVKKDEEGAVRDQTGKLGEAGRDILEMWEEVERPSTPEGRVARDADYLEMVFTAREIQDKGNRDAEMFIESASGKLETESAKKLLEAALKAGPSDWWKKLQRSLL